nr:RecName: Full=Uncharacterized 28.2 kDa protein in ampR 5'region [Rhodobacter capsulatus]CAA33793.1 unnamed protein product [Rhodobacter capsulatus]
MSSPSRRISTRLLLVEILRSIWGWACRNASSRGISQHIAKVVLTPTFSTSMSRRPPRRSSTRDIASNPCSSTGKSRRPSSVGISPWEVLRNSAVPSRSSSRATWWLTAAWVTRSSIAALVKLPWRMATSNTRRALSGRSGRSMAVPQLMAGHKICRLMAAIKPKYTVRMTSCDVASQAPLAQILKGMVPCGSPLPSCRVSRQGSLSACPWPRPPSPKRLSRRSPKPSPGSRNSSAPASASRSWRPARVGPGLTARTSFSS